MTLTHSHPATRVALVLTKLSITSARLVNSSRGISAKGSAKLRTTCESTSIRNGSIPLAIKTSENGPSWKLQRFMFFKFGVSGRGYGGTCKLSEPRVNQRRVEIHNVWHYRCAEHADCCVNALVKSHGRR